MLTALQIILAAEEGEEESGIDLLVPEIDELIAGIIAFAIVFFFIWKWAFPAINRALEARQAAIGGRLEQAEKAKAEAESLLEDYRQQLAEAREEGNRIVEEARRSADEAKAGILTRAQGEADEIRRKAQEDAAGELARARSELRGEVASLSVDVAEKLVSQRIDRETSRQMIDRFIDELGGLGR